MAQTLTQAERLRRRVDFERVYQQGLKAPGRFMTLFLLKNGGSMSRLGIAATRKICNAVVRNRAKRMARAIFRQHKPGLALDLVVLPRREFFSVEFASLEAEYQSILSRREARAPSPVGPPLGKRQLAKLKAERMASQAKRPGTGSAPTPRGGGSATGARGASPVVNSANPAPRARSSGERHPGDRPPSSGQPDQGGA